MFLAQTLVKLKGQIQRKEVRNHFDRLKLQYFHHLNSVFQYSLRSLPSEPLSLRELLANSQL